MINFAINEFMNTNFKIVHKDTVTSTNDDIKKLIVQDAVSECLVLIADEQTAGRGQRDNKWFSLPGENLTISIAYTPQYLEISKQFYLSKAVSLAVFQYLSSKTKQVKIKWPNDILCFGKKICGILVENSISSNTIKQSIIGIGLNLNQIQFPAELNQAVSLRMLTNTSFNIRSELDLLLIEMDCAFQLLQQQDYQTIDKRYHQNLLQIFSLAFFKDSKGIFKGRIIGTLIGGQLIIEDEQNNLRTYNHKEVEFV
jgi:BirA family transcriptional regulator, biotin operon repressor / biotin---[acetyl-CoA-carboxylase] ligase